MLIRSSCSVSLQIWAHRLLSTKVSPINPPVATDPNRRLAMSLSIAEARMFGFQSYLPAVLARSKLESCRETYKQHRHRVYSLAFWTTDNELAAEQLMIQA